MASHVDLSAHGLKLLLLVIPGGADGDQRFWLLRGAPADSKEAAALGFHLHPRVGWAMAGSRPEMKAFQAVFPQARQVEWDPRQHAVKLDAPGVTVRGEPEAVVPAAEPSQAQSMPVNTGASATPDPVPGSMDNDLPPLHVLLGQSEYLGTNKFRQKVYRDPVRGRFIVNNGQISQEADVEAPGLFLRGGSERDTATAAEGFALEIMDQGPIRIDGLRRFACALFDLADVEDSDPRLARAAFEAEAGLARQLLKSGNQGLADLYNEAVRMHEKHPWLGDLARHGAPIASPPMPVAIAAQRILGIGAEMNGKRVVVHGAGAGTLFAHLPQDIDLHVYEADPAAAGAAASMLAAAKRDPAALSDVRPEYSGADRVILAPMAGLLDKPRRFDDLSIGRSDLAEVADSLVHRAVDGRSVFIIQGPVTVEDKEEFERFQAWVARRYLVDGTVDIDPALHAGRPEAAPLRMLIVGARRARIEAEPHPAALKIGQENRFDSLWTWVSEVVANNRLKIAEYLRGQEAESGGADGETKENSFQVPYASMSKSGQSSSMVPRSLEGPTREALQAVVQKHGDIDAWVARELEVSPERLAQVLSPEQIDGLALAFHAIERNRGFLNADDAGLGKGRFGAALARYALLHGYEGVLYLTEKEMNLSDVFRDLRHTGFEDDIRPLVFNPGADIIDEATGEVALRGEAPERIAEIAASKAWPAGVNFVAATYSQFNRNALPDIKAGGKDVPVDPKSAWLRGAIHPKIMVICDESHNASSGVSNVSANVASALNAAGACAYLSATWAHNAENMSIYNHLFPKTLKTLNDMTLLTDMVKRGGETLQEILSGMLVRDGVMIRREHDFAQCVFKQVPPVAEEVTRNHGYMDLVAPILAEMAFLSGDLDKRVNAMNEVEGELHRQAEEARLAAEAQARAAAEQRLRDLPEGAPIPEELVAILDEGRQPNNGRRRGAPREQAAVGKEARKRGVKSLSVSRVGFGSPLYQIARLFVAALLVDKAVERAEDALLDNKKPVILVENTIQGLLEDLAATQGEGGRIPDFKDLLHRTVTQMTQITRATRDGKQVIDLGKGDPIVEVAHILAERLVEVLPEGITRPAAAGARPPRDYKAVVMELLANVAEVLRPQLVHVPDADFSAAVERIRGLVRAQTDNVIEGGPACATIATRLPAALGPVVKRIRDRIDQLPDLEVSAIDAVRTRIEARGRELAAQGRIPQPWVTDEITGRTWELRNGRIVRRPKASKTEIKNRFNAGHVDCLVFNTTGATGIDLHASRRFADHRQRRLIQLQPPGDVRKLIQAYGRVNRFDQVIGPEIEILSAGLPIEARLIAMLNTKLRRLSANIRSDRQHSGIVETLDIINPLGDVVCQRYGDARPDLLKRMGFEVDHLAKRAEANEKLARATTGRIEEEVEARKGWRQRTATEETRDAQRSANEFLARLAMLPVKLQDSVMRELVAEYVTVLEELEARGLNPLKPRTIEGKFHLRSRQVFSGIASDSVNSQFDRAVYAVKGILERTVAAMSSSQLEDAVERGQIALAGALPASYAERIESRRERILEQFKAPTYATVAEALAQGDKAMVDQEQRLTRLVTELRRIAVGNKLSLTIDGMRKANCVIIGIEMADPGYEHLASQYHVKFVVPGDAMPKVVTLGSLIRDDNFALADGLASRVPGEYQKALKEFDQGITNTKLTIRHFLMGNEWEAIKLAVDKGMGTAVRFLGVHDNNREEMMRGVLVHEKHDKLQNVPVIIQGATMARDALLQKNAELHGSEKLDGSFMKISRDRTGHFLVQMPVYGSTNPDVYADTDVQKMVRERYERPLAKNQRPRFTVPESDLLEVLQTLMKAMHKRPHLFLGGSFREWATEYVEKSYRLDQHAAQDAAEDMRLAAA